MMYADVNGVSWKSCKPGMLIGNSTYTTVQNFPGSYFDIQGGNICSGTTGQDIYIYKNLWKHKKRE